MALPGTEGCLIQLVSPGEQLECISCHRGQQSESTWATCTHIFCTACLCDDAWYNVKRNSTCPMCFSRLCVPSNGSKDQAEMQEQTMSYPEFDRAWDEGHRITLDREDQAEMQEQTTTYPKLDRAADGSYCITLNREVLSNYIEDFLRLQSKIYNRELGDMEYIFKTDEARTNYHFECTLAVDDKLPALVASNTVSRALRKLFVEDTAVL